MGGQRLLATFAIDPDDPQMLPKAASDWLDAQRRRKANGEAPDLPAPVADTSSRATVGSLVAASIQPRLQFGAVY
jgi:hypothetical protein